MFPVVKALEQAAIPFRIAFTGQHTSLYEDVEHLVPTPDYHCQTLVPGQNLNQLMSSIILRMDEVLESCQPRLILVQGDTATVFGASLAAFHKGIAIGHVEAGLRTFNLKSPFPEEGYRTMVSKIARFNWAPTLRAFEVLKKEGVQHVQLTGNTIVDACQFFDCKISYLPKILITLHRRENFGERMRSLFEQLESLAESHPQLEFIFPMHPNPGVQEFRHLLKSVKVIEPLSYIEMIQLLSECQCVITDSGGIQEECATFKKRVLICRDTTERPECIEAGYAKLIDTAIVENFNWAIQSTPWEGENPYGAGNAAQIIVKDIEGFLKVQS